MLRLSKLAFFLILTFELSAAAAALIRAFWPT